MAQTNTPCFVSLHALPFSSLQGSHLLAGGCWPRDACAGAVGAVLLAVVLLVALCLLVVSAGLPVTVANCPRAPAATQVTAAAAPTAVVAWRDVPRTCQTHVQAVVRMNDNHGPELLALALLPLRRRQVLLRLLPLPGNIGAWRPLTSWFLGCSLHTLPSLPSAPPVAGQ